MTLDEMVEEIFGINDFYFNGIFPFSMQRSIENDEKMKVIIKKMIIDFVNTNKENNESH